MLMKPPMRRSNCCARRTLGTVPEYFDVTQFDVNVEQRNNAKGERVTVYAWRWSR